MTDTITLSGIVGTEPVLRTTQSGKAVVGFRIASTERRFDRDQQSWVDGHTSWYSVTAWGQLAKNVADSVHKGEPVTVVGRQRVVEWHNADRSGTNVEVDADTVGHSLRFGAAQFTRTRRASPHGDAVVPADAVVEDWPAATEEPVF